VLFLVEGARGNKVVFEVDEKWKYFCAFVPFLLND
jgi:hypothetical protein